MVATRNPRQVRAQFERRGPQRRFKCLLEEPRCDRLLACIVVPIEFFPAATIRVRQPETTLAVNLLAFQ
jgi:hypothetical protein